MKLTDLLNRDIPCACGRTHRCDIRAVEIGQGVLERLPVLTDAAHILLLADANTDAVCGDRVRALLGDRVEHFYRYKTGDALLVPDEDAVQRATAHITDRTDLVLGIGSGVINDIAKYTSFERGIPCGIIATAPSMDGFASSGAAMIFDGMKITFTTHAPELILADTELLATAPDHMIAAGYADIIGKYSALNDWRLSHLVNGEYLCPWVYALVMQKTRETEAMAEALCRREPDALAALTENLILIGVCLTLLSTTRPGSGSEHHLSHYFEITGLIDHRPHFLHGTDVGYATMVTAAMRERIRAQQRPVFHPIPEADRLAHYRRIFKHVAPEVEALQRKAGFYDRDMEAIYAERWGEIVAILAECPTAREITAMLTAVGFEFDAFEAMYGTDCIADAKLWGKDLKDRYSFLWIYFALFGGLEA